MAGIQRRERMPGFYRLGRVQPNQGVLPRCKPAGRRCREPPDKAPNLRWRRQRPLGIWRPGSDTTQVACRRNPNLPWYRKQPSSEAVPAMLHRADHSAPAINKFGDNSFICHPGRSSAEGWKGLGCSRQMLLLARQAMLPLCSDWAIVGT